MQLCYKLFITPTKQILPSSSRFQHQSEKKNVFSLYPRYTDMAGVSALSAGIITFITPHIIQR